MRQIGGILVAVLGISCAIWEGGSGNMLSWDSPEFRQARMALIVLRAIREDSSPLGEGYMFHPSRQVLVEHDAAAFLANQLKPVLCTSSAIEGSLSIDCRHLVTDDSVRPWDVQGEQMLLELREALRDLNPASQPITDSSLILVTGPRESELFPLTDLEAFIRDFRIPFSFSIVPPHIEGRSREAVAVFSIGPTDMIETGSGPKP